MTPYSGGEMSQMELQVKNQRDLVMVTRCKDCKYWDRKKLLCKCPEWADLDGWPKYSNADDYCFRAE